MWNGVGYTGYPMNGYYQNPISVGSNGILKVTGIEGAKAYPMSPNQTAALFDANDNVFWIKTTDSAGFASYKTFRYNEELEDINVNSGSGDQVTRQEFNELKQMVENLVKGN